jgi:hypothetical protein
MDVQHLNPLQEFARNQTAVRHDDATLDTQIVEVTQAVPDVQTELQRAGLHGTRGELAAASALTVRSSDDDRDVVTGVNE